MIDQEIIREARRSLIVPENYRRESVEAFCRKHGVDYESLANESANKAQTTYSMFERGVFPRLPGMTLSDHIKAILASEWQVGFLTAIRAKELESS